MPTLTEPVPSHRPVPGSRLVAAWMAALVFVGVTIPAVQALDREKAAAMMAKNAMHAYEAGDYRRASELYETAFGLSAGEPMFLYSAARAADAGGLFDRADTLYQRARKHPNCTPATAEKIRQHQQRLSQRRASIKADQAALAAKKGQHALAALLYREAARQDPNTHRFLYHAGESAYLSGDRPVAKKYLQRFVERATPKAQTDANTRRRVLAAKAYLARIDEPAAARSGTMPAASSGGTPAPTASPITTRRLVIMGGGVMVLASAVIGGLAWRDQGVLLEQLNQRNANGLIDGISHNDATTTSASIGTRYSIALGLAAVGGLGALAAVLWPEDEGSNLALRVRGSGLAVRWSFR